MERGPSDRFQPEEISQHLAKLSGWEHDPAKDAIQKTYTRKNFLDAVDFIKSAAEIAERQDHHPDILLHKYKNLTFMLTTHSAGGVTQNDIDLARALDQIA